MFRFVAIDGHPTSIPQTTVLRLDLWVPLLLAASHFGLSSPKTSTAFALGWLADETFGLLFAGAFGAAVALSALVEPSRRSPRHLGAVLAPLAGAAVVRVAFLGGLLPVAAQRYASLRLGFMPISPTSLVWPVLGALFAAVALGVAHRAEPRARLELFACALVGAQLVYFFGRSHEHNLVNLAGAWLLPVFLVIARLYEVAPRVAVSSASAVLLSGVAFVPWGRVDFKRSTIRRHWNERRLLEPNAIEETVASLEAGLGRGRSDVVLLDMADGYLNFRLGYPQRGPIAPFQALLTLADASDFVARALESNALVTCIDPFCPSWVTELDNPALVQARGYRFEMTPRSKGWDIRRADR